MRLPWEYHDQSQESGCQLESLRNFDHHTHFMTCTVTILSCNHVLWLYTSLYVIFLQKVWKKWTMNQTNWRHCVIGPGCVSYAEAKVY